MSKLHNCSHFVTNDKVNPISYHLQHCHRQRIIWIIVSVTIAGMVPMLAHPPNAMLNISNYSKVILSCVISAIMQAYCSMSTDIWPIRATDRSIRIEQVLGMDSTRRAKIEVEDDERSEGIVGWEVEARICEGPTEEWSAGSAGSVEE